MSFIANIFSPKKTKTVTIAQSQPDFSITETTTKLVGKPLSVIYGNDVHVMGNVVYRKLSEDKKSTEQIVAFGWGPLTFTDDSIRVNEKRPEYINDVLNPTRSVPPGFIPGCKVKTYNGDLGQTGPTEFVAYGLNRTACMYVMVTANEQISQISTVEVKVSRGPLFVSGDYQTPIPAEISAAFPSGIPSSNVIAAGLDYLLNTDYGTARDINSFGDYSTWISAINYAATQIDIVRSGFVSWQSLIGCFSPNSDGLTIQASGTNLNWDSEGFSFTKLPEAAAGDNLCVFNATAFSVYVESRASQSCQDVVTIDPQAIIYGTLDWAGEAEIHTLVCNTVFTPINRYEGVFLGLDTEVQVGTGLADTPLIKHAIHLRTDGNYEIWENGVRIRANSGQGGVSDPLTEGNVDIGYDGAIGFDSEWVFGTYAENDQFSIGYESGSVVYKKGAAVVYTSLLSTSEELMIVTHIWQDDATAEIVSVPGQEKESRFRISHYVGTDDSDTHMDVLQGILDIGNASIFESNGEIKVHMPQAASTVAALTRADFNPNGSATPDILEIPNVVEIEYKENKDDDEKKTAIFEDPTHYNLYGEIRENIEMHGIPERHQASRKASYIGRKALSEKISIRGTADQKYMNLEPGDLITLTVGYEDTTWFSAKKFWVEAITPENSEGDVDLDILEYGGDSLFDDSASTTIEQNDPILDPDPTIRLPNANQAPDRPLNVTATAIIDTSQETRTIIVELNWEHSDEPEYMRDKYLIYRRALDTDPWVHIDTVSGSTVSWKDASVDVIENSYLYAVLAQTSVTVPSEFPDLFDAFIQALIFDIPPKVDNPTTELLADSRVAIRWEYDTPPLDFSKFGVFVRPASDPNGYAEAIYGGVTTKETKTDEANVPGDYIITILARDLYNKKSEDVTVNFTMPHPNRPQSFNIEQVNNEQYKLTWEYEGEENVNLAGVKIRYTLDPAGIWETATPIHGGIIPGNEYTTFAFPQGNIIILLASYDTAGNMNPVVSRIAATISDPTLENAIETFDFKTGEYLDPDDDWPLGTLVDGSIVSTNLEADSTGGNFYRTTDGNPIYDANPAIPLYDETFSKMIYTTPSFSPTGDGRMTVESIIDGPSFLIEFKGDFPIIFFSPDSEVFFDKGPTELFFDENEFITWPGAFDATAGEDYVFRVTTYSGLPQGTVEQFKVHVDVPDIVEEFDDVSIGAGGTRLSLTKTYTAIKTVILTIQDDAGDAWAVKAMDKDETNGPLIQCFDDTGVATAGTIDARVVGY